MLRSLLLLTALCLPALAQHLVAPAVASEGVEFSLKDSIIRPPRRPFTLVQNSPFMKYSYHSLLGPDPIDSFPVMNVAHSGELQVCRLPDSAHLIVQLEDKPRHSIT